MDLDPPPPPYTAADELPEGPTGPPGTPATAADHSPNLLKAFLGSLKLPRLKGIHAHLYGKQGKNKALIIDSILETVGAPAMFLAAQQHRFLVSEMKPFLTVLDLAKGLVKKADFIACIIDPTEALARADSRQRIGPKRGQGEADAKDNAHAGNNDADVDAEQLDSKPKHKPKLKPKIKPKPKHKPKLKLSPKPKLQLQPIPNPKLQPELKPKPKPVLVDNAFWTFQLYMRHKWKREGEKTGGAFQAGKRCGVLWRAMGEADKHKWDASKRRDAAQRATRGSTFLLALEEASAFDPVCAALAHDAVWLRGLFGMFSDLFPEVFEQMGGTWSEWYQALHEKGRLHDMIYASYSDLKIFNKLVFHTYSRCELFETSASVEDFDDANWRLTIRVNQACLGSFDKTTWAVLLNFVFTYDEQVACLMSDPSSRPSFTEHVLKKSVASSLRQPD